MIRDHIKSLFVGISILFINVHTLYGQKIESKDKLWSILICTLSERQNYFNRIYTHLEKQIEDLGLKEQIEILYFSDNREHSIGFKRNILIANSSGKYICFADDDDMVSDNYVKLIYEKLQRNPDCVGITCVVTYNGKGSHKLVQSNRYTGWIQKNGQYFSPPTHLNPIRRSIAIQFKFREINLGEDTYWARDILNAGLLRKEEIIETPCYYYLRTNAGSTGHMIPAHLRKQ